MQNHEIMKNWKYARVQSAWPVIAEMEKTLGVHDPKAPKIFNIVAANRRVEELQTLIGKNNSAAKPKQTAATDAGALDLKAIPAPVVPVARPASDSFTQQQLIDAARALHVSVPWNADNKIDKAQLWERMEVAAFGMHLDLPGRKSDEEMSKAGHRRFDAAKMSRAAVVFNQQFLNRALGIGTTK